MADQFGRKANLIVSETDDPASRGLDLSEFRFTFRTKNTEEQTPNTLYVRIYNLKRDTVNRIGTEFNSITLQAGYENGNFGIIFHGTIKQTETGRERNVDSYVDVWAADGDEWYNFAVANLAIRDGATPEQIIKAIVNYAVVNGGKPIPFADDATGLIVGAGIGLQGALSRGKVMMGMARDYVRDWATKYGFRWSIQQGKLVLTPITGYRPGRAVVLSSTTGLIGVPRATAEGVKVTVLLNPLIRIGCLVQIAQSDINHITTQQIGLTYNKGDPSSAIVTTAQGFYRVMSAEFEGDTRGNPWYVQLVCLAVDVTASDQNNSVRAAG
jgi:hypothetical protein